jgi:hypothetical protein
MPPDSPKRNREGERNTRSLKIGVTAGSEFLHKAHFLAPSMVSVGRDREATIVLRHPDVPRRYELFSIERESCLLQFDRHVDLAFFYDGLFRRPNYLIDEGLAFRRGRNYYLNLERRARGTIAFGPYRLLFKLEMVIQPRPVEIQLPGVERPSPHCGACGQPLELALPRAGVLSLCAVCGKFNQFSERSAGKPVAPPGTDTADQPPILLDRKVEGPAGLTPSVIEEAATVLDAGVIQQMEGTLGGGEITPPSPPPAGAIDEVDTGLISHNPLMTTSEDEVRQAVNGDVRHVGPQDSPPRALVSGSVRAIHHQERDTGAKIVPLPMSPSARRRVNALSSAPHHPVIAEPRDRSRDSGSWASAKLADRLTLLVFALVLIALLLACILGVLLVQGPLRAMLPAMGELIGSPYTTLIG